MENFGAINKIFFVSVGFTNCCWSSVFIFVLIFMLICLFSTCIMSSYKLRKVEVAYELRIRALDSSGTANDLRKRLSKALSINTPVDESVVNSLNFEDELKECKDILADVKSLIQQYEGDFNDDEHHRIVARLVHLNHRACRIPIPGNPKEGDDSEKRRTHLQSQVQKIFNYVESKIPKPKEDGTTSTSASSTPELVTAVRENESSNTDLGNVCPPSSDIPPLLASLNSTTVQSIPTHGDSTNQHRSHEYYQSTNFTPGIKAVPVYKWRLNFDGSSNQSIGSFLERVEEIRRARGVTEQELFQSAVDLFTGQALIWFRSTAGRVKTWHELCKEMCIVFRSPDYDFRLQHEIFNRIQGDQETIDMFIAAMEGLYGRLSSRAPESTRLMQILNNLHPTLQDRLALCDITSIEDLRRMGRKAEAGRFRAAFPRSHSRSVGALEPDLAYAEPQRRRAAPQPQIASVREVDGQRGTVNCWNCGATGHRHHLCKEAKKKFCYGCGKPDTFRSACTKCSPKNGGAGKPTV